MAARQLREYIVSHRRTTRETTYFTRKCLQNIAGRLQPGARVGFVQMPGAASGAAAGHKRGTGGDLPPFPEFDPISEQQLKRFKVDYLHDGTLAVLKQRGTPPAATWHYVVPADDLHLFLLSLALAGLGINRAFAKVGLQLCAGWARRLGPEHSVWCGGVLHACHPSCTSTLCTDSPCTPCHLPAMQAYQQYRVRLSDNPDGTPRWTGDGAEGLGKGGVAAWSKLDIVAADRRPLAPAADPPIHPFQVNRINEHWQASAGGLWGDACWGPVHVVAACNSCIQQGREQPCVSCLPALLCCWC